MNNRFLCEMLIKHVHMCYRPHDLYLMVRKLCKYLIHQKYLKIMSCVCTPGYKRRLVTHQFTFFPRRRLIRCSKKTSD